MKKVRFRLFGWALGVLILLAVVLAPVLALTGCHRQPTAVVVQPAPDYTVDSSYTEPVYDPSATVVCIGGRRGYYDSYRVFHPVVVVGGFEGYYDSRHRFVSSAPGVRIRVQQHGPPPAALAMKGPMQTWHAAPARPNVAPARPVARSSPPAARTAPSAPVVRSAPRPATPPAARSGPSGGGRRR